MKSLPDSASVYRRTASFDESSIPAGLRRTHSTKAGVWGRIRVEEGRLLYRIFASPSGAGEAEDLEMLETVELSPGVEGVIEPEVRHQVEPLGAVRFHVEFLREPAAEERQARQS